jgi:hypothetical protein
MSRIILMEPEPHCYDDPAAAWTPTLIINMVGIDFKQKKTYFFFPVGFNKNTYKIKKTVTTGKITCSNFCPF